MLLLTGVMLLAMAGSDCSRKSTVVSDEPVNANAASAESPFASITDADAALAEGNRLLDEDQTEQAILALKQAIKLNADLPEAHFKLGIAYSLLEMQMQQSGVVGDQPANSKNGKTKKNSEKAFERAVDAYKKWIAANPKDDVAEYNLGRTYAKLGLDDEAEKAFRQAVKLKPEDSEYQTELGAILIKLAKYHEAIDPLKEAVDLDEQNVRAQDLLDDAEAGRQRLDYVSPKKDANQAVGNKASNSNANTADNANVVTHTNSNSGPKPPPANITPKLPDPKDKKPNPPPERPRKVDE